MSPAPPLLTVESPSVLTLTPSLKPPGPSISNAGSSRKLPGNSYMDIHLSKLAKSNSFQTQQNHTPGVTATGYHKPILESLKPPGKTVEKKSFFIHVASMKNRDPQCSVSRQDTLPSPTSLGDGGLQFTHPRVNDEPFGSSMSMTWPRANLSLGGISPPGMGGVPPVLSARSSGAGVSGVSPLSLKGPVQINADAFSVADGKVLTSSTSRSIVLTFVLLCIQFRAL